MRVEMHATKQDWYTECMCPGMPSYAQLCPGSSCVMGIQIEVAYQGRHFPRREASIDVLQNLDISFLVL